MKVAKRHKCIVLMNKSKMMNKKVNLIVFIFLYFAISSYGQNKSYVMLENKTFHPLAEYDFSNDSWIIVNSNWEGNTEIIFNSDSVLELYKKFVTITPIELINSHASPKYYLQIIKNNECIGTIKYYISEQVHFGNLKNHFVTSKEKKIIEKSFKELHQIKDSLNINGIACYWFGNDTLGKFDGSFKFDVSVNGEIARSTEYGNEIIQEIEKINPELNGRVLNESSSFMLDDESIFEISIMCNEDFSLDFEKFAESEIVSNISIKGYKKNLYTLYYFQFY